MQGIVPRGSMRSLRRKKSKAIRKRCLNRPFKIVTTQKSTISGGKSIDLFGFSLYNMPDQEKQDTCLILIHLKILKLVDKKVCMDSESQTSLILSQVETRITELENNVQDFERATADAEQQFDVFEHLLQDETEQDETLLEQLTQTLQASQHAARLTHSANSALNQAITQAERVLEENLALREDRRDPLPDGRLVCQGRYRLIHLLYQRPRIHLYLAQRADATPETGTGSKPLVAIRELVLTGLEETQREQIIQAAFEEFAAPRLFGSPHLAGVADRVFVEKGRHYLVMQPRPVRGSNPTFAVTLTEFLANLQEGSGWLDMSTALKWGIQLCRTVADLHRLKNVPGELTPEFVLVDREAEADWSPILLAGWPPALSFWPGNALDARQLYNLAFPALATDLNQEQTHLYPFIAPEVFAGQRDERSDVYTLGALLYLLFTHQTPMAAPQRLLAEQATQTTRTQRNLPRRKNAQRRIQPANQNLTLTAPHLLNEQVSLLLEQILLRALALKPEERFGSPLDLAEALSGMNLKTAVLAPALPQARVSRLRKLLVWLKKER